MKIKSSLLFISFLLFLSVNLIADDKKLIKVNNSFITKFEYGEMLYNNPRGIGCNTCHGSDAKGKDIVSFTHVYDKKKYNCVLSVPNIKSSSYDIFFNKVNSKKNPKKKFKKEQVCEKLIYKSNIMPTYFLVEEEIDAIYYYIKNLK
ncbi:c-type cytochrome [Poseidonibacter lekithochrous]|uniref:c-type cytochrome n=1 Tax=Poseidonibacter TaxID=2321187 RepID=UPI001C0897ED|nr:MULTISPECIES: c-type cytochrome [Poseidonibacter]MBU3013763.1 c-type cytochrome [Poseidonibacter lekithochrous]MDO6827060.1 c-type cytochrome [Poseidonibacter sp. 1_MG-2023]